MHVDFHSKEDLEAQYTVMENQPDGPCIRLRLKADGNMVDVYVRHGDDAYALYHAAVEILDYFDGLDGEAKPYIS